MGADSEMVKHDGRKCRHASDFSGDHRTKIDDKVWVSELIPIRDIEAITGRKTKILP